MPRMTIIESVITTKAGRITMTKFLVIFCTVLAVSIVSANDEESEANRRTEYAKRECVRVINRGIAAISEKYASSWLVDNDRLFEIYHSAAMKLHKLAVEVREAQTMVVTGEVEMHEERKINCPEEITEAVVNITSAASEAFEKVLARGNYDNRTIVLGVLMRKSERFDSGISEKHELKQAKHRCIASINQASNEFLRKVQSTLEPENDYYTFLVDGVWSNVYQRLVLELAQEAYKATEMEVTEVLKTHEGSAISCSPKIAREVAMISDQAFWIYYDIMRRLKGRMDSESKLDNQPDIKGPSEKDR